MARSSTTFQEGNEQHLTHGAFSYMARVKDGRPLTEHMRAADATIAADYAAHGARGMLEQNAKTFQAAALLIWQAMMVSPENFEALVPRWGWLAGNAARLWRELAAMPADDGASAAGEVLASYREVSDDKSAE